MTDSETGSVSELILEADFSFDFKSCFLKKAMDFLRERKKELTESIKYFEIYICLFFLPKCQPLNITKQRAFLRMQD